MTDAAPAASPALPDLSGRVALVTGASRGIGRAVAVTLAAAGAHVVALARTKGALEELDDDIRKVAPKGDGATLVPHDVTDGEAMDRLGFAIFERFSKLDVLIANAGLLGPLSPLGHVRPQDFDKVMAVNVTANWRLIRAMDPLLKQSDAGRAVFVTSGAARKLRAYWGPYAVSKAALEALARTYAAECEHTAIRVNLFNPGPVATRMRSEAMPGEDPATLPSPEAVAPFVVALAATTCDAQGRIYDFPTRGFVA